MSALYVAKVLKGATWRSLITEKFHAFYSKPRLHEEVNKQTNRKQEPIRAGTRSPLAPMLPQRILTCELEGFLLHFTSLLCNFPAFHSLEE